VYAFVAVRTSSPFRRPLKAGVCGSRFGETRKQRRIQIFSEKIYRESEITDYYSPE
jgi:hypothetical protein